jgi:hypothetical protein
MRLTLDLFRLSSERIAFTRRRAERERGRPAALWRLGYTVVAGSPALRHRGRTVSWLAQ